ncbi:MAG TPA: hypothetical protein P5132_09070 [Bacteroidales bacterium]|nr:hypothetical protein [Bacteroidales bacterium]
MSRLLFPLFILVAVAFNSCETLILKEIKYKGTETKGHKYKLIEDSKDEGTPNTLKNKQSSEATSTAKVK